MKKLNLPTKLTILRIVLAFVLIFILTFPFYRLGINIPTFLFKNILLDLRYLLAGVIFVFASFTDYLDGMLARKRNQVTDLGKFLDAIADKVLVDSVLIIFASYGFISAIVPVVIIVRDIIVDGIRQNLADKGVVQAAKMPGKIKTAMLMVGITLMFFYNLPFEIWGFDVADAAIYFGVIMAIVSLADYWISNRKILFTEKPQ